MLNDGFNFVLHRFTPNLLLWFKMQTHVGKINTGTAGCWGYENAIFYLEHIQKACSAVSGVFQALTSGLFLKMWLWSHNYHIKKKCKVYSAAGLTIDSKCEASSQTRKSKSTSMRQYPLCNLQLQEKEQKKKSFKLLETWKRNESALFIYLLLDTVCEHIQKRSLGRLLHHWAARRRSWLWSVRQSRDSPRRASPQTPGIKTDVMGVLSNAISSKWCN